MFTYQTQKAATAGSRKTQNVYGIASLVEEAVVNHFLWYACCETLARHFKKPARTHD